MIRIFWIFVFCFSFVFSWLTTKNDIDHCVSRNNEKELFHDFDFASGIELIFDIEQTEEEEDHAAQDFIPSALPYAYYSFLRNAHFRSTIVLYFEDANSWSYSGLSPPGGIDE